jgi:hypothetical protein
LPDLVRFADKHQLKIGTIHDLIEVLNEKNKENSEKNKKKEQLIEHLHTRE